MHIEEVHENADALTRLSAERIRSFRNMQNAPVGWANGNIRALGDDPLWIPKKMYGESAGGKREQRRNAKAEKGENNGRKRCQAYAGPAFRGNAAVWLTHGFSNLL
jgi:hypothetical protein